MRFHQLKRREFITLLGGAAAWPLVARAQHPAVPVVGYLGLDTPESQSRTVAGVRRGLSETGFVEDRSITIEYRWAQSHYERFPQLTADLVGRRVNVIFAQSPPAVRAATAASASIPIVFIMGEDPVEEGLVASLNRPGGNVTGVSDFSNQLAGKQLGLLRDAAPKASVFALLVNPAHPHVEPDTRKAQVAAAALGLEMRVLRAGTEQDLDVAFAEMLELRAGALLVNVDPYFAARREQLVALAARHAIPAVYTGREFPAAGGLMSYEADRYDASRLAGIYVARILKGEKPANLPVQQATKFDFVINLKTAKTLGLTVPPSLLAIADEVIE